MNAGLLTLLLFGSLVFLLALGLPLAFAMGGVAVVGIYFVMGPQSIPIIYFNVIAPFKDITYVSIPLFIFMAYMLERAGIAENLYTTIQYWAGRIKGSLAMGTVIISTILAAMVGLSSASIITMGVTVLPAMIKRGYDRNLAMGAIAAGSTLGILIPPSVLGALYAMAAGVSVGRMFLAGFLPGLLISGIFILYIGIRCYLNPKLGPAMPPEERVSQRKKLVSLSSVILPSLLVVGVLGSIFLGIATVTESAAVGALGSILLVFINRKFTWKNFKEVNYNTMLLTLMIMWMMVAACSFRALYVVTHAGDLIQVAFMAVPGGKWGAIIASQLILLIMGLCLDEFEILIIALPIFVPVMRALGVDLLWWGILFVINMEAAEISPPLGLNLFCMKAVVGDEVPMEQIWRAVMPFVALLMLAIIIIMIFPPIATYLPEAIITRGR
jgi:tripartite ATP-independent transporter DctM subunit